MGRGRWALMHELRGAEPPPLEELLQHVAPCDLVLVEGFGRGQHPKLEVWRAAPGTPPLATEAAGIVGIATDAPAAVPVSGLPLLDLADTAAIADFVLAQARPR